MEPTERHVFMKPINADSLQPKCAICGKLQVAHFPLTNCQVCGKYDYCLPYLSLQMCNSCRDNEQKLQEISKQQAETRVIESQPNRDNVQDAIRYSGDFYNANVKSFLELRDISSTPYEYAALVEERVNHLQNVLQPAARKQLEQVNAELYLWQKELNAAVAKLEVAERANFQSNNVQYQPPVAKQPAKPIVKKPKIKTAEDAVAYQYIKSREAAGKPIRPVYEVYKNGELLLTTKDKALAEIKAKESTGLLKEISVMDVAREWYRNTMRRDESESSSEQPTGNGAK